MRYTRKLAACAAAVVMSLGVTSAFGQSFNIDMNTGVAGAPGEGAPTNAFGAAANSAGFWNAMTGTATTNIVLNGLNGAPTPATLTRSSAVGGSFAFNNANTTGDFELLLDDGHDLSGVANGITYTFAGLVPGPYRVFTYAVAPDFAGDITVVTVTGASPPNPQTSGGAIPFNSFVQGITHTLHDVVVSGNGLLTVMADGASAADFGTVNGFQLVYIPEPASLGVLTVGALLLGRRRR